MFDIQAYLRIRDIQNLNCWSYDEFEKGDYTKSAKISNAKRKMIKNKTDWIGKGMVGRFINKYLGI